MIGVPVKKATIAIPRSLVLILGDFLPEKRFIAIYCFQQLCFKIYINTKLSFKCVHKFIAESISKGGYYMKNETLCNCLWFRTGGKEWKM